MEEKKNLTYTKKILNNYKKLSAIYNKKLKNITVLYFDECIIIYLLVSIDDEDLINHSDLLSKTHCLLELYLSGIIK